MTVLNTQEHFLTVYVNSLYSFFFSEKEDIEWYFTKASTIIDSVEKRMGAKPANKDLVPLLHNIKNHLVDFKRTLTKDKGFLTTPYSLKEAQATNREVINRKDSSSAKEGVNTFKGHKVIHVTDDFEGFCLDLSFDCVCIRLISLIPTK